PATDQVTPAPTTTVVQTETAGAPVVGQSITLIATVAPSPPGGGSPDGTVTFTSGSTAVCSAVPLSNGVAVCSTAFPTSGSRTINASYSGSASYTASASTSPTTVNVG